MCSLVKSLKYLHEAYFCHKIQLWNQNCGTEWSWVEMTSEHINWSTLKAISYNKKIYLMFFLMEGGPKICPTLDDFII